MNDMERIQLWVIYRQTVELLRREGFKTEQLVEEIVAIYGMV